MPSIVTTYPGVYIQELFSLQLSVQEGSTAVPIFADNPANGPATAVRINSWLDFVSGVGDYNPRYHAHRTLKAYFENGGGPCYLVNADNMLQEVPKHDDITLLVSAGWDISDAVDTLCVDGSSLFAIVDGPRAELGAVPGTNGAKSDGATPSGKHDDAWEPDPSLEITDNGHVAAYYPWLTRIYDYKEEIEDVVSTVTGPLDVPPSAVLAGIYCANDRARGVWKAPANISVKGGYTLKHAITDTLQGEHNQGSSTLNMLRDFRTSGVTVWGARTRKDEDNWRYIPVRRLFDAAERDIKSAMQAVMFEPNTSYTWTRVRAAIEAYLYGIWQQGGLQGDTPGEAFFVQVGLGLTMTQADIDAGQMIVKIGLRPARPVEFIILQFTQEMIAN